MKYAVTLAQLQKEGACQSGYNKVVRMLQGQEFSCADEGRETYIRLAHKEPISILSILDSNGLDDALWALRCIPDIDRDARLFAVWCARQVQHLMTDPRSINALDVAERFANGEADYAERAAARAAGDAAWAAGEAAWAAGAAAWAARAAAWAAGAAAWAAGAAAWAAGDAARAAGEAAVDAQKTMFIDMCNGHAPWQMKPAEMAA